MEKIGSTMQFQFHTSLTAKISFVTVFCYKCEENRFWHTLDSKELLPMLVIKMMGSNFLDINHYKWCKAISVPSPSLMTSFYVNLSLQPWVCILAQVYEWTKCSDIDSKFSHHLQYSFLFLWRNSKMPRKIFIFFSIKFVAEADSKI